MIEKMEQYLKDTFGNVEITDMSTKEGQSIQQLKVSFRNLIIIFNYNVKLKTISTKLEHTNDWTFKEFSDIELFRGSIHVVTTTLEKLLEIIATSK